MELQVTRDDLRKSNKRLNKVKKEFKSNNTKITCLELELKKVKQKASKINILAAKKTITKVKGK